MAHQTTPEPSIAGGILGNDAFEITRHFTAPPERVFDAWVGDAWAQWLPFPHAVVERLDVHTHVGGHYHLTMRMPNGQQMTASGVYREVQRPTRLVFTWLTSLSEHASLVSVTLQPSGGGTRMVLRHEGLPIPELRESHRRGWLGGFERLEPLLLTPQAAP
ncbi:SRPBCC domain-containing protein [Deinococcus sp. KSM4-11]|uniref:SRPBCC family protein n=1 Tax=Deinococcus sp. KSM4-11 TaxID=2568654 RepID=UPI0010A33DF6|nr:SRPBCC domain-containing protein [Deinococcus sp. KSM4-11]THF85602.1 SRPBCC domain-containing protein [Deinococcus sp. KSM4-11]